MGGTLSRATRSADQLLPPSPHQRELEEIYEVLCQNGTFHKESFMRHFSGPSEHIAELLFKEITDALGCLSQQSTTYQHDHHRRHLMSKSSFMAKANKIIEKAYVAKRSQLEYYYGLIAHGKDSLSSQELLQLLIFCCTFGLLIGNYSPSYIENLEKDQFLIGLIESCANGADLMPKDKILLWIEETNHNIFASFQAWLHLKLTSSIPKSHFQMLPVPVGIADEPDAGILTPSLLWHLCCVLPPCFTHLDKHINGHESQSGDGFEESSERFTWSLLYDSSKHGLSLNRFKHKCMDYKSPTVTLLRFKSGLLLALLVDTAWQDSSEKFGGSYSALMEILPSPAVVVAMPKCIYLKSSGRNVYTGLQVGHDLPPKFRLDTDFYNAEILYKGSTLDEVSQIEVWGCGGVHAVADQQKQKQWDQREIEKRRKVKRPGRWEDNPDRSILEMGGVCVSHNERGDV